MKKTLKERFDEKWVEADNGCWLWTAAQNSDGYGSIRVAGATLGAHRVSYELYVSEIPDGIHVLHTCDNPACVNPNHFFLGTHQDNMSDRNNKFRQPLGEEIGNSVLTQQQVIEIRVLYKNSNLSMRKVAAIYDISYSTVQNLISGKTWKHLP